MVKQRFLVVTVIMIVAAASLLAAVTVYAQDATGTPALEATAVPTKAPTAARTFEPLTQADLTLLTGNVQRPNGITWMGGKIYTACTGDGTVYVIDDTTGETRTLIYGVRNAQTLYVEADNSNNVTLWVPDFAANVLARVSRSGVVPVVRDLNGPWGIDYVDEDRFLVTQLLSNNLVLLSRDGDNQVVLEGLSAPMGIVHDDATIYLANYGSTRRSIEWYDYEAVLGGADAVEGNHVLVSGLQNATGVQLGSDGKLYFAYALGNRGVVGRVDPEVCKANGGCTANQVEVVLYSDLAVPLAGLTITPDMRMFIHTMFTPDLYWTQING